MRTIQSSAAALVVLALLAFGPGLTSGENRSWTSSVVGEQLEKTRLHRLDGRRYRRVEMEKEPDFFLFYYSASWCPPCRASAPQLVKSYTEWIENNPKVEFVHISLDRDGSAAARWASGAGFPWLTVLFRDSGRSGLLQYRTADSVPYFVLVDADGNSVANGASAAFAKISELSAESE